MTEPNPSTEKVLYLKYWHVVLMLAVQLIGLGYGFGVLKQGEDDLTRRVSVIEQTEFVPRKEYEAFKSDLRDTLARIESEILHRNQTEERLR